MSDGFTCTKHRYEISIPMKMISSLIQDVNASLEGGIGVKI